MFAREAKQEYDPFHEPTVERPLATRPLSVQVQGNAWAGKGIEGMRNDLNSRPSRHARTGSVTHLPQMNADMGTAPETNTTQMAAQVLPAGSSPLRSSLSSPRKHTAGMAPERYDDMSSDDEFREKKQLPPGRGLHRHAKSVTFDEALQIRQFEMTTPELSSVGTCSPSTSFNSEDSFHVDQDEEAREEDNEFELVVDSPHNTSGALLYDPAQVNISASRETSHDQFVDAASTPSPSGRSIRSFFLGKKSPASDQGSGSPNDRRPLPPIPGFTGSPAHTKSSDSPVAAPRDMSPMMTPAVASDSPSTKPTLEERLRMIMRQDSPRGKADLEQRERRMRRAGSRDLDKPSASVEASPAAPVQAEDSMAFSSPSSKYNEASFVTASESEPAVEAYHSLAFPDPDVPIPSTENDGLESVKDENESQIDLYSIPQAFASQVELIEPFTALAVTEKAVEVELPAKTPETIIEEPIKSPSKQKRRHSALLPMPTIPLRTSLPEITDSADEFKMSLSDYITPETTPTAEILPEPVLLMEQIENQQSPASENTQSSDFSETSVFDEAQESDMPDSPASVIRHPISPEESFIEPPVVPEPVATIKAPGGKLKVRASATPADIMSMAAARRQASGEKTLEQIEELMDVPPRSPRRPSLSIEDAAAEIKSDKSLTEAQIQRRLSLLQLDVPVTSTSDDFSFGLDKDFDRVIEGQKVCLHLIVLELKLMISQRGYLMRQNTKVIVASANETEDNLADEPTSVRGTRSAGNSPVKKADGRAKSWEVEPWNGRARRGSLKNGGSAVKRKMVSTAPPLPGMESSVTGPMESVAEDEAVPEEEDEAERGRLFVRVVSVKDLDLQLPRGERAYFSLTLDNGLHCVTTSWLELGRNAPIGQEFELVVMNDLEFQLTLQAKMEKPLPQVAPKAAAKDVKPKASALSRVFGSPKKRKERERQEEEERQALQRQQTLAAQKPPSVYEMLQGIAAEDGNFARSYICAKDHEAKSYGKPYVVEVPCFNEWAVDKNLEAQARSKRGTVMMAKRPPYRIGKLELQLLFVPKPKGVKDPQMPKSMNACIRELKEAQAADAREWQGHLSQQGGDCPVCFLL
jgi:hypothetical protein